MKLNIVKEGEEEEVWMEVGEKEPILGIKKRIEHITGTPVKSQILYLAGWELIDGLDIDDYPILSDGSKIELIQQREMVTTIIINVLSTRMEMEVRLGDSLKRLKERIHEEHGVVGKMRLFYKGEEMCEDGKSVEEYGVGCMGEVVVVMVAEGWVRVVVQTAKGVKGGRRRIGMEVEENRRIEDLRNELVRINALPVDDYVFVHRQKVMNNLSTLRWNRVRDGDFLYVFKGRLVAMASSSPF